MEKYIVSFRPAPFKFLKPNTFAEEDVYCFEGTRLLVRGGTFIDQESLYKIRGSNRGRDTIYVSNHLYIKYMQGLSEEKRIEREEKTGYSEVKQETVEMLSEIIEKKEVNPMSLLKVSVSVSNRLESTDSTTIFSLISALAPKDEYMQRHCVNTGLLNGLFGRWLGFSKEKVDRLVLIGLLHDAGKALMPKSVLGATRGLTNTEFEVMKQHPLKSYDLLHAFPDSIRNACRWHHERYDGVGYPDGLKGDEISIEARITAISDVYDAIVSQRSYKVARSPFAVMALLKESSGKQFDPALIDIFMKSMPHELAGKEVLLSDGSVGTISSIDPNNIEYPIVDISGNKVRTNKNLHCTSML